MTEAIHTVRGHIHGDFERGPHMFINPGVSHWRGHRHYRSVIRKRKTRRQFTIEGEKVCVCT